VSGAGAWPAFWPPRDSHSTCGPRSPPPAGNDDFAPDFAFPRPRRDRPALRRPAPPGNGIRRGHGVGYRRSRPGTEHRDRIAAPSARRPGRRGRTYPGHAAREDRAAAASQERGPRSGSADGSVLYAPRSDAGRERPEITVPLPQSVLDASRSGPISLEFVSVGSYGESSYLLIPVLPRPWRAAATRGRSGGAFALDRDLIRLARLVGPRGHPLTSRRGPRAASTGRARMPETGSSRSVGRPRRWRTSDRTRKP
jgi:hypothetical protein